MSELPKKDVVNYQLKANDFWFGIEEGRAVERAARKQRVRGPDDPFTMAEAAAKLGCSVKTLKGHIEAGRLRYFTTGHGSKRQRKMVTAADLNEFIAAQSRKDSSPCPSTKTPRSPFWQFDFQLAGHRFHGSTKATTKREAETVERSEREKARQLVAQVKAARTSLRLQDVATRYWTEVGQHHRDSQRTWHQLGLLLKFFGPDKLITDIIDGDVARLVPWRRGHRRPHDDALISPFTVNDLTEQLKKLFTKAKAWGVRFDHEPRWRQHWLQEPPERVRELVGDEGERLEAETRDDYLPLFRLAQATGLRLKELCLLKWNEVDWDAGDTGQIRKEGKGGRLVTRPITSEIRAILWPLRGHHPEHVFTFVAQRDYGGRKKGERYPVTLNGVKSHWRYLRKRAGVTGFRFHDFRHDFGTKLLRATGNLKLVQKALNHANLKTTSRYAHVLDGEVAAAMERLAESRKKSRTKLRIVS